jgi:hypothetical protein
MWAEKKDTVPRDGADPVWHPKSLLDRIGWKGLLAVGWHSTPLPLRAIALPYTLIVYRRLLAASDSPKHLLVLHSDKYQSSLLFRALRPRFRRIRRILAAFEIKSESVTAPPLPLEPYGSAADLLSASSLPRTRLLASHARIAD